MIKASHIALVLHDFPAGGSERIAIRLANLWAIERRVTILCGSGEGPARQLVGKNVQIHEVAPAIPRGSRSRERLGKALAVSVAALTPDIVVGPGNFHLPVLSSLARHLGSRRPAMICKLSNALVRPDRSWPAQKLFEWRLRRLVRSIDRIAVMSDGLGAEARIILPAGKIVVIPGPNLPTDPLPREHSSETVILAAGRLVAQKNFALALDAFARIPPGPRLALLGDGPERAALAARAKALGIVDRIDMPGAVPDIAPWLARAKAFLLTSHYEGYPSVLIEAIAAGVPVVTTPCSPAIPEIVADPRSGRIVPPDPARLAGALTDVIAAGPPSPEEQARLRRRHAPDASAAAWLTVLDRLVAERRG